MMSSLGPEARAGFEISMMDVPTIVQELPDDRTLFLMYYLGSPSYVYYGSRVQPLRPLELSADGDQIAELVTHFRTLVRQANDTLERAARGEITQDNYNVLAGDLEQQANEPLATLYRLLVQPLESAVPEFDDYTTMLIYPPAELRLLPFGALRRTRFDGRQEHWVESRDIVYFPCGAPGLAKEHMSDPVLRVRGEMLMLAWPGSRAERNYIENVLHEEETLRNLWTTSRGAERFKSLREGEATLANLLSNLDEDIQILHLATHGNLRPGDPQESFISLANQERLRVTDLWTLPLSRARLVVLSMCNAEYNPEGLSDPLGTFARAIYATGCPSVVASLWRVRDDSALALMTDFYENLVEGEMSRVGALSEAQRAMIATRGTGERLLTPLPLGAVRAHRRVAVIRRTGHPFRGGRAISLPRAERQLFGQM